MLHSDLTLLRYWGSIKGRSLFAHWGIRPSTRQASTGGTQRMRGVAANQRRCTDHPAGLAQGKRPVRSPCCSPGSTQKHGQLPPGQE